MIERNESTSSNRNRPSRSKRAEAKRRDAQRRSGRSSEKRRLALEGLESRELLAGDVPFIGGPLNLPSFTGPRNIGTVAAFNIIEAEGVNTIGENDFLFNAQPLPLGNLPGQEDTIDLTGSATFQLVPNTVPQLVNTDIDTYSVNLQAGDILDISVFGAVSNINVFYGQTEISGNSRSGTLWFATDTPQNILLPADSPLQSNGNANASQVVPETGTYFIQVAGSTGTTSYQLGLRTYRPISESLPVGVGQIIYLDFNGGTFARSVFGGAGGGVLRVPSFRESLPLLGVNIINDQLFGDQIAAIENQLIDDIVEEVELHFQSVATNGTNGDFDSTGVPGQYGVTILNSRDNPEFDPQLGSLANEITTHVLIGGSNADIEQAGLLGISSTLDIGNFSLDDLVLAPVDLAVAASTLFPFANNASVFDAVARTIAITASHEAGHSFGLRHTDGNNFTPSLIDGVGVNVPLFDSGAGTDGIVGTFDDTIIDFREDQFDTGEGFSGSQRVAAALAHSLSTGRSGASITGQVFSDLNQNGNQGAGETGLAGVTVFADFDGDGVIDPTEPQTTTSADGSFALVGGAGTATVTAITPSGFTGTTPGTVVVNNTVGGSSSVQFGFFQTQSNITGRTFVDTDGDGVADPGEGGLEDIFIYLDLDGDDRPDLGEPSTQSSADGTYNLNFPGPGNFTIRQIVPPGFEQTFPTSGEHNVFFDGVTLNGNFDFGLLPAQDFGDAPASFGTLTADDGASHGIVSGLQIGSIVDREIDGLPSLLANGDDGDQLDDEDGVRLLGPLGPGASSSFEVNVTNTSGLPAFLQGFFDFNGDGDFIDAGEQFATGIPVDNGTSNQNINVPISVPNDAVTGNSFARFRLSFDQNLGPTGFVGSGEVEDHTFPILASAEIANDDPTPGDVASQAAFSVPRNSLSNPLDVLANDFDTPENPLTIDNIDTTNLQGIVVVSGDQRSVDYTPPNGFVGIDTFDYTVVDQFGNQATATVVVTVTFQSDVPIAVDDSFEVPEGSVNRALNVLDNDVPSVNGGLTITSVTPGTAGGSITIVGGGQSLRYTPVPGFNGTEQFTYSVQDSVGAVSTAEVTLNLLPGSLQDDLLNFSIGLFDPTDINTPITNVQVGDTFLLRVSVDDLRDFAVNRDFVLDTNGQPVLGSDGQPLLNTLNDVAEGVASAFLDLLYTDELVSVLQSDLNPAFPFDITFGELFSGSEGFLQRANADTPGLIDEVGGIQPLTNQQSHLGPVELFTIGLQAIAPGVAQFTADPADDPESENVLLDEDVALPLAQVGLGSTELVILPSSDNFTSAIDDSFADNLDSDGVLISSTSVQRNRLDVLANDNLGETGTIQEFGLVTNPTFGNVFIDNNGTPDNLNDDFLSYQPNANANGLERFTYVIVTADNVRSTAEVTIPLGNVNANAIVGINFADSLVDRAGNPLSSVSVGDEFGVQIELEDLRTFSPTFVFAGFLDILYDAGLIEPVAGVPGSEFDFDVVFSPGFAGDAGVGTAAVPGIINEFGTLSTADQLSEGNNPDLLATIFFQATASGSVTISGGPADSSPFQDTLLFLQDEPVEVDQIRYDTLTFNIGPAGTGTGGLGIGVPGEGEAVQNPTLAQDVNNDGSVSPIDALLIINELSRVPGEGEAGSRQPVQFYTDVNGDARTTAIDALQVVNYLSRVRNNTGEGEQVLAAQLGSPATIESTERIADEVFATLSEANRIFSAGTPQVGSGPSGSGPAIPFASSEDSGDESASDVLDVLADDIQGLWS